MERRAEGAPVSQDLWAIVLAAGDGTRLAPLTRALYGQPVPKQFAALSGDRSLLQTTIERISPLVPLHQIVVVANSKLESTALDQLARYPGVELVLQPRNLDTGPGILLPLVHVMVRAAPDARVAVFPADHHVPHPEPLLEAVKRGDQTTESSPTTITLVGAVPDAPETEYGWIVPGAQLHGGPAGVRAVAQFVEKPTPAVAQRLLASGGLWNTFISTGRVETFWSLASRYLPVQAPLFMEYLAWLRYPEQDAPTSRCVLQSLYARMAAANFSRSVLERARELAVVPMAASGWCDWGSPERVFQSLHGTAELQRLIQRIAGRSGRQPGPVTPANPLREQP
jgi:mannose-1-phosphate guanylyltransferase